MGARSFERVESWSTRQYAGHGDLHALTESGFSGAVSAGGTWVFVLNGRVVGVFDGTLDDALDAEGTVYEAPDPAPVLLTVMQEGDGEVRGQYYTNDTPLPDVDETLRDSSFTGYVELSENVLSGDYYVVYYGGRAMPVAFVGASGQLLTGDEAFERAADEVGIYRVVKTDVDVTEVPEPPESATSAGAVAVDDAEGESSDGTDDAEGADAPSDADADGASADGTDPSPATGPTLDTDTADEAEVDTTEADTAEADTAEADTADAVVDDGAAAESDADAVTADAADTTVGPSTDSREVAESDAAADEPTSVVPEAEPTAADDTDAPPTVESTADVDDTAEGGARVDDDPDVEASAAGDAAESTTESAAASDDEVDDDRFEKEREWRNTTSIPTVAPSERGEESERRARQRTSRFRPTQTRQQSRSHEDEDQSGPRRNRADAIERLRSELEARTEELASLRERAEQLRAERDELQEERDDLAARRDELASEVESLREELDSVRADLTAAREAGGDAAAGSTAAETLTADAALDGTDLFVRYGSRGEATLDDVPDGADADAVNANLRLEHHTQFDETAVTVDGDPFEAFLEETGAHRFVSWVVRTLPYEIRETGHRSGLGDLFEALPDVDRAEFRGTVDVESEGEEGPVSRTFDVVLRDRMGAPLLVADINARRDPVTGEMMEELVEAASAVADGTSLAAACYVTESFFEPAALEVTEEATGGGFLSRSSKESFVKTSRKRGYHLCLVESRRGSFYLNVPEL